MAYTLELLREETLVSQKRCWFLLYNKDKDVRNSCYIVHACAKAKKAEKYQEENILSVELDYDKCVYCKAPIPTYMKVTVKLLNGL